MQALSIERGMCTLENFPTNSYFEQVYFMFFLNEVNGKILVPILPYYLESSFVF